MEEESNQSATEGAIGKGVAGWAGGCGGGVRWGKGRLMGYGPPQRPVIVLGMLAIRTLIRRDAHADSF